MFKEAFIRLFRFPPIAILREPVSIILFRSGILCHSPAIGPAVFVLSVYKVRRQDETLHLQAGQDGVEPFLPVFAVSAGFLQHMGKRRTMLFDDVEQVLVPEGRQFIIEEPFKIIPVPTVVRKIQKPLFTDVSSLLPEELSIGTIQVLDDRSFPGPGIVSGQVVKERICRAVLFDRKPFDGILEVRQEPVLLDGIFQVLFRFNPKVRSLLPGPCRSVCRRCVRTS